MGRGVPAVCGCAEGGKGDTTFLLSTSVVVYCHAGLLSRCIVFTSFIKHGTGTALPDDNGRTLVTTAPCKVKLHYTIYSTG